MCADHEVPIIVSRRNLLVFLSSYVPHLIRNLEYICSKFAVMNMSKYAGLLTVVNRYITCGDIVKPLVNPARNCQYICSDTPSDFLRSLNYNVQYVCR